MNAAKAVQGGIFQTLLLLHLFEPHLDVAGFNRQRWHVAPSGKNVFVQIALVSSDCGVALGIDCVSLVAQLVLSVMSAKQPKCCRTGVVGLIDLVVDA
jgi:hypothetical protein